MKLRLIRLGSLITLYNGIYALIYGVFLIIFNKVLLSEYFRNVPVRWVVFARSFPYRARLYSYSIIAEGFLLISFGIFIIYLSYFILKRKDKLAWVVLFLSGIISWASLFLINIFLINWVMIVLCSIGWIFFIIGMLIPIKYYLQKGYKSL